MADDRLYNQPVGNQPAAVMFGIRSVVGNQGQVAGFVFYDFFNNFYGGAAAQKTADHQRAVFADHFSGFFRRYNFFHQS